MTAVLAFHEVNVELEEGFCVGLRLPRGISGLAALRPHYGPRRSRVERVVGCPQARRIPRRVEPNPAATRSHINVGLRGAAAARRPCGTARAGFPRTQRGAINLS
jgi:hypothetical protein